MKLPIKAPINKELANLDPFIHAGKLDTKKNSGVNRIIDKVINIGILILFTDSKLWGAETNSPFKIFTSVFSLILYCR